MPDKDLYGGSDISYTDDYNIGTFGEFDRFEDERAFAPDVVEQERGIYPLMQRHAPDWMKNMYRGAKGAWGGITDDTITGPGFINHILEWTNDYISPSQQIAQSQWKKPENMEKTIQSLKLRPEFQDWTDEAIKNWLYNTARANRGGIIGLI